MSRTPRCRVCGSSAPILRATRTGTLQLCYYHEAVCTAHMQDPCPECEAA